MVSQHTLCLAASVLVAGCSSAANTTPQTRPSGALDTSAMWPSMSVQSYGDGARVYAALLANDGGAFLELTDGDALTATLGGVTATLTRLSPDDPGKAHYVTDFAAPADGAELTVAFARPAGKASVTVSTRIGAPFAITSPAPAGVRVGDRLVIGVAPTLPVPVASPATPHVFCHQAVALSNGDIACENTVVRMVGDCVDPKSPDLDATFDGTGTASVDTSRVLLKASPCSASVQVRYTSDANIGSPPWSGKVIEGLQARSLQTTLTR
jgi:hypothetical protein